MGIVSPCKNYDLNRSKRGFKTLLLIFMNNVHASIYIEFASIRVKQNGKIFLFSR